MTREELVTLLAEVGGGGEYIGEQYHSASKKAEDHVTGQIKRRLGTLLLFGDAINQFYVDTIGAFSPQLSASQPQVTMFSMHWHIVSSTRCRAAFDLWKRGYYFEAATLSRTLWETALTLAGLQKRIVTIEELFGGRVQEGVKQDTRKMLRSVQNADLKVQKELLWENTSLAQETRQALNAFMHVMNQSTHKSNLAVSVNINRQSQHQTIPIFSHYDEVYVGMAWNIFFVAIWSLSITLKYVELLHPAETTSWHTRYDKLLCAFKELSNSLSEDVREFGKVIDEVFLKQK